MKPDVTHIATVSTSIEVSDAAAIVNTENGTIGDTKKFNQVVQLPMNYRGGSDTPLAALVAVPGVQQDSSGNQTDDLSVTTRLLDTNAVVDQMIHKRDFDLLLFPLTLGADPDLTPLWKSTATAQNSR